MKTSISTLLTALCFAVLASFSIAEETINQEVILNKIHDLEQQTQKPAQSQSPQQQTQPQVRKPTPSQSPQQQTQQVQRQTQSPRQRQTQQQAPNPTQSQSQQQTQQQIQKPTYVKIGPHWKVGTTWSVETINLQKPGTGQRQSKPVIWVFTVVGETTIGSRNCFEVAIRCKDGLDWQPRVSIWVDKVSGMLMRVTTLTLVNGRWRTFTETYSVPEGKSVAVLGSIPSLPLDMPLFTVSVGSKDLDGMTYEVITGSKGAKALNETGFTYKIDQVIKPVTPASSKELAGAKTLDTSLNLNESVEVELKSGSAKRIRQIWVPDCPWPIYSTNGVSESRLLDISNPQ